MPSTPRYSAASYEDMQTYTSPYRTSNPDARRPTASPRAPAPLDADTVDYWDETGVPAPYRLSTAHSASPYPALSSPHNSPVSPPRPATNAYLDQAHNLSSPTSQRYSNTYRIDTNEMQELHDAPGGRLSMGTYMPSYESNDHLFPTSNSYYNNKTDSVDDFHTDFSHHDENDAWGLVNEPAGSRASLALARERYISRKEAALAASGGAYDYSAPKPSRFTRKQKWWFVAIASFLLAIVLAVGIFFGTKGSSSSSSNSSKDSSTTSGAVSSDPNDPSKFTKDSRLHQSMYGVCYTPFNAQYPSCGATQANVTQDIQLLSQLTTRLRLYGADCNVSQLVLEAIKQTKVSMQVFLAIWVDDDDATFQRQVDEITDAIKTYGTDNIAGVTVGNEYLLNGGSVTTLLSRIQTVNTTIQGMNLAKHIPVGTGDAGSMVTTQLASGADYVMANVHPWFGGLPVDQAAGWIWEYTNTNAPSTALLAPNKPTLYVAEAGWPTGANATKFMTYEGATAGIDQLNTFLSTFVCASNNNVTSLGLQPSFIFEAFDEPWKDPLYGGVEAHWGLFDSNRKLKDGLTIPDCAAP